MKNIFSVILCLFFYVLHSSAQDVTMKGSAPGAAGKTIKIISYADLITYNEKVLAKAIVDNKGNFSMTFPLTSTVYTKIKIMFGKTDLYLEPHKTYELMIDSADYNVDDKYNPFLSPKLLNVSIINAEKNELNSLMQKFNMLYNEYTFKHFDELYVLRQKNRVDTFRTIVNKNFPGVENEFFNAYVKYSIASLEALTQYHTKLGMAKKYFINQPVLYDNPAYMTYFNEFFEKYILGSSPKITLNDIDRCVNKLKSVAALTDTLGKDTILRNEVLRELVMTKGLFDMYYTPGFEKENSLLLLNDIAANSKFEKHRTIAKDMIEAIDKLRIGTAAPPFTLNNITGNKYSLTDFKGKYVYLIFWNTQCASCIREMDAITKLKDTYAGKLEFVAISSDREALTLKYYLEKKYFGFTMLHFGGNWDLLESYDIKAFPQTMLIDDQGKIAAYLPPLPSEGMENYLNQLFNIIPPPKKNDGRKY